MRRRTRRRKSKEERRKDAEARQAARAQLVPEEQLAILETRRGESKNERVRLEGEIISNYMKPNRVD